MFDKRKFIPELIEDKDIIFNKDSDYHKQKQKERRIQYSRGINQKEIEVNYG